MLRSCARPGFFAVVLVSIGCLVGLMPTDGQTRVQNTAMLSTHISKLREQIKAEEAAHANAERLATLWLNLGQAYEVQFDYRAAEGAFLRVLHLLRGSEATDQYASALDWIAGVYLATERVNKAERSWGQALELAHRPGGSKTETRIHEGLAVVLFVERKYAKAEKQASEALRQLEAQANPDVGEMIVPYMTRSRALCGMRRCKEALQDADRAWALVENKIQADPMKLNTTAYIEAIGVTAVRGMEQVRSGAVDQGLLTFQQALRMTDDRADLPVPSQIRLRMSLLVEYSNLLGSVHREQERKKVKEELARAKAQRTGCDRCTVSAAALGLLP